MPPEAEPQRTEIVFDENNIADYLSRLNGHCAKVQLFFNSAFHVGLTA